MKTFFHWIIKIWFHCLTTTTAKKKKLSLVLIPTRITCVCVYSKVYVCVYLFLTVQNPRKTCQAYRYIQIHTNEEQHIHTDTHCIQRTHLLYEGSVYVCCIFLIRISSFSCIFIKIDPKECLLSLSISLPLVHSRSIVIVALVVVIFGRCMARRSHVTIQQCAQRIKIHHILKGNTLNLKTSAGLGNDIVFVLFLFSFHFFFFFFFSYKKFVVTLSDRSEKKMYPKMWMSSLSSPCSFKEWNAKCMYVCNVCMGKRSSQ